MTTETKNASELSLGGTTLALARHYLGGRRGMIAIGVLALAAGLASNWAWLVAAGIAPLLLAAAPCAVMCALGLCMARVGGKSCAPEADAADRTKPSVDAVEVATVDNKATDTTAGPVLADISGGVSANDKVIPRG